MRNYVLKRLILFTPTIIGVSLGIFVIMRIMPGDVAVAILQAGDPDATYTEAQRQEVIQNYGLDRPLYIQYIDWLWDVARFDLGESWARPFPIARELKRQIPVTAQLALFSAVIVALVGVPAGALAAVFQDRWPDYVIRLIAVSALAVPSFFLGLLMILILSRWFEWLPPPGFVSLWDRPWDSFRQLIFPASALGFHSFGIILRMTRGQLLEVMREDYVRTARAKGLSERVVVARHALRNALLPVVTIYGFQVIHLLGGAVAIELIFSMPGVGQALLSGVFNRDLPVVQVYVMYLALLALTINLLVDMTYAWLDPRIQYR